MRVFEQCIHSKAPWVNAFAAWSEQPVQFMVRGDLKNMECNLSHIIHMYRPFLMVVHLIFTHYLAQDKKSFWYLCFGGNPILLCLFQCLLPCPCFKVWRWNAPCPRGEGRWLTMGRCFAEVRSVFASSPVNWQLINIITIISIISPHFGSTDTSRVLRVQSFFVPVSRCLWKTLAHPFKFDGWPVSPESFTREKQRRLFKKRNMEPNASVHSCIPRTSASAKLSLETETSIILVLSQKFSSFPEFWSFWVLYSPTAECYGVFAQYRFRCVLGELGRFREKTGSGKVPAGFRESSGNRSGNRLGSRF